jgi:hypothetical protein
MMLAAETKVNDLSFAPFDAATDFPVISTWWKEHKWPIVPLSFLPRNGIVIRHLGKPICAGFIYLTDTPIGLLEWVVSDPKSNKKDRDEALHLLIQRLCWMAQILGVVQLFSSSEHPKLSERLEENGFKMTSESVKHFLKEI